VITEQDLNHETIRALRREQRKVRDAQSKLADAYASGNYALARELSKSITRSLDKRWALVSRLEQ
jgi:hypothetical protein